MNSIPETFNHDNTRQPSIGQRRFTFGTSQHWHNGDNHAPLKLNKQTGEMSNRYAESRFTRFSGTAQQLVTHIMAGHAITPGIFKDNWRKTDNFIQAQLIAVDCDENVSVNELAAIPFVQQYGLFIHATKRSTPESPRSRVYFLADAPINSASDYQRYALRVAYQVSEQLGKKVDEQCSDAARRFFGCANAEHITQRDKMLPMVTLEALPPSQKEIDDAEFARQRAESRQSAPPVDAAYAQRLAYREINRKAEILSRTGKGNRNAENRSAAFYAGTFVGAGAISEQDAFNLVYPAALAAGRPADEAEKTTRGGLKKGAQSPADIKPPVSRQRAAPHNEALNSIDDTTHLENSVTPVTDENNAALYVWQGTPPDAVFEIVREGLPAVSAKRIEKILRLLNAAIERGLVNPCAYTVETVKAAADTLKVEYSVKSIERALKEIAIENVFSSKVVGILGAIPHNFDENKTGRPPTVWQLHPITVRSQNLLGIADRYLTARILQNTILSNLNVEMLRFAVGDDAEIIADDVADVIAPALASQAQQRQSAFRQYRQAYDRLARGLESICDLQLEPELAIRDPRSAKIRAFFRSVPKGQPIRRSEIAKVANCSISYVSKAVQIAGGESEPHYEYFEIASPAHLSETIGTINWKHKCMVLDLSVKDGDQVLDSQTLPHASSEWVTAWQAQGCKVYAHARMGNAYRIVREPAQKSTSKPRAPVEHFITGRAASRVSRLTPEHDYRYGINPRWVFDQVVLATELITGYQAYHTDGKTIFIDTATGKTVCTITTAREAISMLLGSREAVRSETPISDQQRAFRRHIAQRFAAEGWHKVETRGAVK